MDELTIAKILTGCLPRLKHREPDILEWEKANPFTPTIPLVEKATYVGVEIEVENVPTRPRLTSHFWECKNDGSLRNNGREFVTPPLKVSRLEHALHHLFNVDFGFVDARPDFSERTSVHVHMNVRTLTLKQLETFILTYMVIEKALFNWVGHNRANNIFCVPLHDLTIGALSFTNPEDIRVLRWSKYTALNLLPILDRGTVEFRHLYGTKDPKIILQWVNFLLSIKMFALKNSPEYIKNYIYSLNTDSQYAGFLIDVFKDHAQVLFYPEMDKDISACVSNIKAQCLYYKDKPKFTHTKVKSKYKHIYINKEPYKPGRIDDIIRTLQNQNGALFNVPRGL